jgi:hypothetical protein
MCRADGSKLIADGDDAVEQLELKNLNPDKLKRYEQITVVFCVVSFMTEGIKFTSDTGVYKCRDHLMHYQI